MTSQLRKSAGSYSQHSRDCKNCSLSCTYAPSCLRDCNFRRLGSSNRLAATASTLETAKIARSAARQHPAASEAAIFGVSAAQIGWQLQPARLRLQKLLAQLRVSTQLPPRLQFSTSRQLKSAGSYSQHA
ncbi:hypothetical protein [Paenibacillus qinlingensis]|uniref:Transposase DDE domain-containing protein n=1 Tax=Paenibacillus qinlingensis TaxID=1837343 RepID=A0ABU1P570_9BACL|nr:hypothetical protein [Paenibacillus qinlingensis]MDR6554357.1 hypothetical protein [Paenibacillus qinlingensis]